MSSATESTLRRDSAEFTYMPSNGGFDMSGSGGGPFTVFFRLVSSDNSPGHRLQPMTPLHTPFTQSPVHSPMQPSVPGGPMMSSGDRGALLYPHPSPPMGPMGSPSLPGVYYTTAPRPPPPGAGGYYGPGTGGLHFANIEQDGEGAGNVCRHSPFASFPLRAPTAAQIIVLFATRVGGRPGLGERRDAP